MEKTNMALSCLQRVGSVTIGLDASGQHAAGSRPSQAAGLEISNGSPENREMTKDEVVDFVHQCGVDFVLGREKEEPSVRFHASATKDSSLNFHCRGPAGHLRADFVIKGRSREDNIGDAKAFIQLYAGERGRSYEDGFTVFVRLEPPISAATWLLGVIQAYWASQARLP